MIRGRKPVCWSGFWWICQNEKSCHSGRSWHCHKTPGWDLSPQSVENFKKENLYIFPPDLPKKLFSVLSSQMWQPSQDRRSPEEIEHLSKNIGKLPFWYFLFCPPHSHQWSASTGSYCEEKKEGLWFKKRMERVIWLLIIKW